MGGTYCVLESNAFVVVRVVVGMVGTRRRPWVVGTCGHCSGSGRRHWGDGGSSSSALGVMAPSTWHARMDRWHATSNMVMLLTWMI